MSIAHIFQFTIQEFHFQLSVSLIRCVCQTATFNYLMLTNVLFFRTLPLRMLRVPPLWSWMIQWLEIYLCTLWQCLGMDCLLFSTLKDYLHKLTSFQGIIPSRTFLSLPYETAFFIIKQERGSEKQTHANDGGVEKNDENISYFVISFVFSLSTRPPRVRVCETPRCFIFVAVVDDLRENRS